MKALFIGGPKAGCVIDIAPTLRFVDIPVPGGVYRYRVRELDGGFNVAHQICVSDDLNPLQVLMNFYAEAKHS